MCLWWLNESFNVGCCSEHNLKQIIGCDYVTICMHFDKNILSFYVIFFFHPTPSQTFILISNSPTFRVQKYYESEVSKNQRCQNNGKSSSKPWMGLQEGNKYLQKQDWLVKLFFCKSDIGDCNSAALFGKLASGKMTRAKSCPFS